MEIGDSSVADFDTRCLAADEPGAIEETAVLLQQGYLIIFPTDTVYGVGVDAWNGDAIMQLYQVKQRPFSKAIPILLSDLDQLSQITHTIPDIAYEYIQRFWPGALTLILPKNPDLPAAISPDNNIAVRVPDCTVARALIRAAGGALAATSANRSGQPPAATAAQALKELGGRVTAVLDNGPTPGSAASTVVNCTVAPPVILREGPITTVDLQGST